LLNAIYLASIVESATVGYFFEYQEIAPPLNMTAYPDTDLQSVRFVPQLAFEKVWGSRFEGE